MGCWVSICSTRSLSSSSLTPAVIEGLGGYGNPGSLKWWEQHRGLCTLSWEQLGRALHTAAQDANQYPEYLVCDQCNRKFIKYRIYDIDTGWYDEYGFKGPLSSPILVLAKSQARKVCSDSS